MQSDAKQLANEVDHRVVRLWHVLLRRSFRELSRTAASVLAVLRDNGPQRITELAAIEAVAQPTMTTLVGRLERDGLVERTPDLDDRRAVRVEVTEKGLELLARAGEQRRAIVEERIQALDKDDRATLAAALPVLDKLIHPEEDS